ncbi:hypothetical protein TRFO_08857 [Tritrichomonas foetus]|uniref:UBX domain-containing protein n=1 Tax=Tritrichomonas foetus TaxID=1144522 RepID=A0A1J4JM07_9EUKA|nr:hypothetical protein TRFO_08857 [Tritrichomonas foetus]|eukprot:OHS98565.1 hypothetical protein TRFO_08857 [Tritrichomonas foetus]
MTEAQRTGLIQQLVQICNCTDDTAIRLLSFCRWDLLAALNLFYAGYKVDATPEFTDAVAPPIIQSLNHDLFTHFQEDAKKNQKWALVYLKMARTDLPLSDRFFLYDYVGVRFQILELDPDEQCTQWFLDFYSISHTPCLAVIDPGNGHCVDKYTGEIKAKNITEFLTSFLSNHHDYGPPLDFNLNCADPLLDEDELLSSPPSPQKNSNGNNNDDTFDDTNQFNYRENNNNNNINNNTYNIDDINNNHGNFDNENCNNSSAGSDNITIVLESLNKKRTQLTISSNETVKSLYQKVASLLNTPMSSISLQAYPNIEIREMSSTIKQLKLSDTFIRVSIIH